MAADLAASAGHGHHRGPGARPVRRRAGQGDPRQGGGRTHAHHSAVRHRRGAGAVRDPLHQLERDAAPAGDPGPAAGRSRPDGRGGRSLRAARRDDRVHSRGQPRAAGGQPGRRGEGRSPRQLEAAGGGAAGDAGRAPRVAGGADGLRTQPPAPPQADPAGHADQRPGREPRLLDPGRVRPATRLSGPGDRPRVAGAGDRKQQHRRAHLRRSARGRRDPGRHERAVAHRVGAPVRRRRAGPSPPTTAAGRKPTSLPERPVPDSYRAELDGRRALPEREAGPGDGGNPVSEGRPRPGAIALRGLPGRGPAGDAGQHGGRRRSSRRDGSAWSPIRSCAWRRPRARWPGARTTRCAWPAPVETSWAC